MRTLFVDVGQGTCQIILLGGGRAIVVDAGTHPSVPQRILRLNRIHTIELLAISHSHHDHSGGAVRKKSKTKKRGSLLTGILADYQDKVKQIGFVQDSEFKKSSFAKFIKKLINEKKLSWNQLVRLEITDAPKPLWPIDGNDSSVTLLSCISPTAFDSTRAYLENDANASSAIVHLRHKDDALLFTGDSEYAQWKTLNEINNQNKLRCKGMSMPHHGGLMDGDQSDLEWFCNEVVETEVVVFSVGTINGYKHPRPEVISAMRKAGATVVCTQMTDKCCTDLESVRPGAIGSLIHPCRSSTKTDLVRPRKKKNKAAKKSSAVPRSRNVACAGTISALITDDGIEFEKLDSHQTGVDKLKANGCSPLCRL